MQTSGRENVVKVRYDKLSISLKFNELIYLLVKRGLIENKLARCIVVQSDVIMEVTAIKCAVVSVQPLRIFCITPFKT
jgi:hypothetical protein